MGRIRALVGRHRAMTAVVLVVGTAAVAFALFWFQPWKLVVDETVDEPLPSALAVETVPTATASPARGDASPSPSGPTVLFSGAFRSLEHGTTGTARILRLADGSRIVRIEELNTSNGPDLIVILSATPASEDSWGAYDDGAHVNLGELKGNIGNQNYAIPSSVDLGSYRSVVIWCRRFTVGFGAAPIA